MPNNENIGRSAFPNVDRRSVLRTASGALVSGAAIAGFSGSAKADHCPDPDSDDEYLDCDDSSNEFDYFYRPKSDYVEGETSLTVGLKGVQYSECSGCVYYYFDLVGIHEAFSEDSDGSTTDYVDAFGFRWETNSPVTPDPQPDGSQNIESGVTDPDGSASPDGDNEDAWWALGDVLVAGGSVLYPALGVPAFLYTIARASSLGSSTDDDEVKFDPSGYIDSGGYGYYNMRMQVHEDFCGTVEFEAFTDTLGSKFTTTSKTFDLDWHTSCSSW